MHSLFFSKSRLNHCIEQAFFKTIIIIAVTGCVIAILFDLILVKRTDHNASLMVLLVEILLLTLYGIGKIDFGKITTIGITMMGIVITYRGLVTNDFNEISCTLLITVGFISSLVSKGRVGLILKIAILFCLALILFKQYSIPTLILARKALPYLIVYCIITICSGLLKSRYELNQQRLKDMVELLNKKNQKINDQNALLKKNYRELEHLNENLESIIEEKTEKISEKNRQLADIAYANAHQIRGPLARILGLLNLANMDTRNREFYFCKISEQASEMDDKLLQVTQAIEANIYK
jgi:signal transduction histidine kinase